MSSENVARLKGLIAETGNRCWAWLPGANATTVAESLADLAGELLEDYERSQAELHDARVACRQLMERIQQFEKQQSE